MLIRFGDLGRRGCEEVVSGKFSEFCEEKVRPQASVLKHTVYNFRGYFAGAEAMLEC